MDAYAPTMMSVGARGMIGKGARLPEVIEAMKNIMEFILAQSAEQAHFLQNASKKQNWWLMKISNQRHFVVFMSKKCHW